MEVGSSILTSEILGFWWLQIAGHQAMGVFQPMLAWLIRVTLPLEHRQCFLKGVYSPQGPAAHAEQAVLPVPDCHGCWVWGLGEWADALFVHVLCFLAFVWTEMSHLSTFRIAEKRERWHIAGLSSGCFIQVITPLDGSFLFLPVLVPLYKWKQVPSIGGVNLEILVNCWEWEKERCIALQAILISLILAECKGAGLDINLFHVLLRLFCTFPSTQHSHPTAARRGWGQSCISQMDTEGMYKDY